MLKFRPSSASSSSSSGNFKGQSEILPVCRQLNVTSLLPLSAIKSRRICCNLGLSSSIATVRAREKVNFSSSPFVLQQFEVDRKIFVILLVFMTDYRSFIVALEHSFPHLSNKIMNKIIIDVVGHLRLVLLLPRNSSFNSFRSGNGRRYLYVPVTCNCMSLLLLRTLCGCGDL